MVSTVDMAFCDQLLAYVDQLSSTDGLSEGALQQLYTLNKTLSELVKAVQSSQSFWNSQLFAAMVGAGAAISVVLIQQLWNWWKNTNERLGEIYKWIAEQHVFWDPRALYDRASRTSYGCTSTDPITGGTGTLLGFEVYTEVMRTSANYCDSPFFLIDHFITLSRMKPQVR
jgi:hypothetical protein